MANSVDPNRVIQKLTAQLTAVTIELAATQVALEDANEVIAKHGMGDTDQSGD
jgi:hypothetical protein